MELQQKHAIVSMIGALGLIVLFAGIFLKGISFTDALFVALSLWILSGVVATFLGISNKSQIRRYSGWRYGIVSLVGSLGVIVLLAGIFLDVPFTDALFVAIVLWISSGTIAAVLGVSKRTNYYNYPSFQPQPYNFQQAQPTQNQPQNYPATYTPTNQEFFDEPSKKFCPKCGTSLELDSTFCSNCGSNVH